MRQHGVKVGEAQQGMSDAAVAHRPWGTCQPLADVAVPGRQVSHQQQIAEQVDVTPTVWLLTASKPASCDWLSSPPWPWAKRDYFGVKAE